MIGASKASIVKQAKDNTSAYQGQTHMYSHRGRVYQSDIYDGPRKMRSDVIKHLAYNNTVSAADLFRIELYLKGEHFRRKVEPKDKERKAIIGKYHLIRDEKDGKWKANEDELFQQLCEEFPAARSFKSFKALMYEVRYGDSRHGPVTVTKMSEV